MSCRRDALPGVVDIILKLLVHWRQSSRGCGRRVVPTPEMESIYTQISNVVSRLALGSIEHKPDTEQKLRDMYGNL